MERWAEHVRCSEEYMWDKIANHVILCAPPSLCLSRSIVCTEQTGQVDTYNSMLASPDGLHLFVRV